MHIKGMLTAGLLGLLIAASGCSEGGADPSDHGALVARGEYLVTIVGCNDCHTPYHMGPKGPEPDMSRMLSGHPETLQLPDPPPLPQGPWNVLIAETNTAFAGPWGVSYSANLTPDPSGIGAWDEEIFVNALRSGKHWGVSREILPPMPWPWYSKMTEEDLRAVFAYLRTVPPIENNVPDPSSPGADESEW